MLSRAAVGGETLSERSGRWRLLEVLGSLIVLIGAGGAPSTRPATFVPLLLVASAAGAREATTLAPTSLPSALDDTSATVAGDADSFTPSAAADDRASARRLTEFFSFEFKHVLGASDAAADGHFGSVVAMSGAYVAVTATSYDNFGNCVDSYGQVYVYRTTDGLVFNENTEFKLNASDGTVCDQFGSALAIDGDILLVGARSAACGESNGNCGAVYVFGADAGGSWTQVATLVAANATEGDEFSAAVAISSDYAVIGAVKDDDGGSNSGAAYVFERYADGWLQVDKLVAEDADSTDHFGSAVAISGDYMVVGAFQDNPTSSGSSSGYGAAYVFGRDGEGSWSQVDKLVAADASAYDHFGWSVAISGTIVVIGTPGDEPTGAGTEYGGTGAAYVFGQNIDGSWTQKDKLTADDSTAYRFGISVAIDGGIVVVGASYWFENCPAYPADCGAMYCFGRESDGSWTQREKHNQSAADGAAEWIQYGEAVAISGDFVVAGAPRWPDTGSPSNAGAASRDRAEH